MKDQLETCGNCIFKENGLCNNPESMYYDLEVAPNSTCKEFEINMRFD